MPAPSAAAMTTAMPCRAEMRRHPSLRVRRPGEAHGAPEGKLGLLRPRHARVHAELVRNLKA